MDVGMGADMHDVAWIPLTTGGYLLPIPGVTYKISKPLTDGTVFLYKNKKSAKSPMPLQFIFDWVYQDLRQKHANAKYIWCKSERKRWDNQPITREQVTLIKKLAPDYKINTKRQHAGMLPLSFKICCIFGRQVIAMPRRPRRMSASGIYHVMIRGINKMQIFNDDADNIQFLHFLEFTQTDEFQILAYCLMGNHAHLLIRTSKNRH